MISGSLEKQKNDCNFMSRELKFRVWNGTKYSIEPRLDVMLLNCAPRECYIAGLGKTIQQYTGYDDKNGKGIYEGDFVKITDIRNTYIIQVFWSDLRLIIDGQREIIGNIFENPELIKPAL